MENLRASLIRARLILTIPWLNIAQTDVNKNILNYLSKKDKVAKNWKFKKK